MSKNKGFTRIISGIWKGKKISFQLSENLRPTPDRAKETLFNWLGQNLKEQRCLDLFSGTGSLGLECLSRKAAFVTFVEKDPNKLSAIKKIIQELEISKKCDFYLEDCLDWLEREDINKNAYDVIFVDPPFKQGYIKEILIKILEAKLLGLKGKIYFEYEKSLEINLPKNFKEIRKKSLGEKTYLLAEIIYPSS
tara:strand:+ start:1596 stop:2177 length:582 start_codon:yes stop_codon:yes gene_type:complete